MSISGLPSHRGPAAVLEQVVGHVRGLSETRWSAQIDDDLVGVVELAAELRSVLAAVEAGAVGEADHRDLAKATLHYGSTADWVTHVGGLRRGDGKRVVARACAVTGPLGATRKGLAAGIVSPEQADVIVRSIDDLPGDQVTRRRGERFLVDRARTLDATDLARAGRHLSTVVDPDGEERELEKALDRDERVCHLTRRLSTTDDGMGGVKLRGRGSAEDGAVLKAALLPLTSPAPAADEEGDPDAKSYDPRDHGTRLWDALVATAQHGLDTDLPPECHGARPRLLFTCEQDTLKAALMAMGVGLTVDGTELSSATVRRLACDADLIPAVLGSRGEILDVGRMRRLVTTAIWVALILRDQHCAFPGCHRPPSMCHGHHIQHWADGGETKLDNLVLLCGHHHRVIHHTPWLIRLNAADRKPEFIPPPRSRIRDVPVRARPRRE
jgi:hypothetical protein